MGGVERGLVAAGSYNTEVRASTPVLQPAEGYAQAAMDVPHGFSGVAVYEVATYFLVLSISRKVNGTGRFFLSLVRSELGLRSDRKAAPRSNRQRTIPRKHSPARTVLEPTVARLLLGHSSLSLDIMA